LLLLLLLLLLLSVPGTSLGYQKHLLSLKVMTSPAEQRQWSFKAVLGGTGVSGLSQTKITFLKRASINDHVVFLGTIGLSKCVTNACLPTRRITLVRRFQGNVL